jgi:Mu transposase, C-terminal domain
VRERVVAEDWLVTIDTNRYSVPWRLIGKTVQVVRAGGVWQIRHRDVLVAEHPVLPARHQLSVRPEHGPGALPRNARKRYADIPAPASAPVRVNEVVEVRDLAVYEQMLEAA